MEETYSKLNSTQKIVVKLFQQLVTECTGWYWLHSLVHLPQQLVTGYRVYWLVLATQPCTLALTTGYRVYRPVPATQSCTLASTLVTKRTGRYRLYSLVHFSNWLHMASTYWLQVYRQGTAYTVLTVQCFTQLVT